MSRREVERPAPSPDEVGEAALALDREQVARLLTGAPSGAASPAAWLARSLLARGWPVARVVLALVELDEPDTEILRAINAVQPSLLAPAVGALLRVAGWPGERVLDALAELGLNAADRAALVDPPPAGAAAGAGSS